MCVSVLMEQNPLEDCSPFCVYIRNIGQALSFFKCITFLFCSQHSFTNPHGLHGATCRILGDAVHRMVAHTDRHSEEKAGILACVSFVLKCAVCICNLSTCSSSHVEKYDLISKSSAWEEGSPLPLSLHLVIYSLHMQLGQKPSRCQIHALCGNCMWQHIWKELLKVSSMSFYLGTYLYFQSSIQTISVQKPLCGYECKSLSCQFTCKIPELQQESVVSLEKKMTTYGWH